MALEDVMDDSADSPGGLHRRRFSWQEKERTRSARRDGGKPERHRFLQRKPEPQAFPGDTYLDGLKESAKTGSNWAKVLMVGVIAGFIADLYFLDITIALLIDKADITVIFDNASSSSVYAGAIIVF